MVKQSATLDSSFWINAHRCGLLPWVLTRFDLRYPPEVAEELSEEFASGREFWRQVRLGVLMEAKPNSEAMSAFGPGERAAINLALQHRDWILQMDDRRPLVEAQRLGLDVICTPVLIVTLFSEGLLNLDDALRLMTSLAVMQTVSPVLIEAAVAQLATQKREENT